MGAKRVFMGRKIVIFIIMAAVLLALVPVHSAYAESDHVLLIYHDKSEMAVLSNLITACGKQADAVDVVEYEAGMLADYDYIVLQDDAPLLEALELNKRVVCVGDAFQTMPGIRTKTIVHTMDVELNVYRNAESVVFQMDTPYITQHDGRSIGSVTIEGGVYPLCVMTDHILYAPYVNADDLSIFAVGQMLNRYFGRNDGGKMYVMIDEVYPFDDLEMLQLTARKLYENGIPFLLSVMPVYYNAEYPSFDRYANALRYIQSIGGSMIMHAPLETKNELVGDPLEVRMEQAFQTFADQGVVIFDEVITPYAITLDALSGMLPQNELYISLPIDTVVKFRVFRTEQELDDAIVAIDKKWLLIGDYRRYFSGKEYLNDQEEIDENYQYREHTERRYAFLVDAGNRVIFVIVVVSAVIVLVLIGLGYRMYQEKFMKKNKKISTETSENNNRNDKI
jgi:hypothetical protein